MAVKVSHPASNSLQTFIERILLISELEIDGMCFRRILLSITKSTSDRRRLGSIGDFTALRVMDSGGWQRYACRDLSCRTQPNRLASYLLLAEEWQLFC